VNDDLLEQIFSFLVSDFSGYALKMVLGHENSEGQEELFRRMLKKPHMDRACFNRVFEDQVVSLKDAYRMNM
jgi:acyl-CoA dehydrogenase